MVRGCAVLAICQQQQKNELLDVVVLLENHFLFFFHFKDIVVMNPRIIFNIFYEVIKLQQINVTFQVEAGGGQNIPLVSIRNMIQ